MKGVGRLLSSGMKLRISRKTLKQLPPHVASLVKEWKDQEHRAFFSVEDRKSFYIDEDARYTAFSADGTKQKTVRAAGEFAGFTELAPGKHCPLPEGCVVVATGIFCGLAWLTIYHNSGLKLAA